MTNNRETSRSGPGLTRKKLAALLMVGAGAMGPAGCGQTGGVPEGCEDYLKPGAKPPTVSFVTDCTPDAGGQQRCRVNTTSRLNPQFFVEVQYDTRCQADTVLKGFMIPEATAQNVPIPPIIPLEPLETPISAPGRHAITLTIPSIEVVDQYGNTRVIDRQAFLPKEFKAAVSDQYGNTSGTDDVAPQ